MYNSFGLVFFIPLIDNTTRGIISSSMIINGILCHGSKYLQLSYARYFMLYDVFCNVMLGLYVLATEKKEATFYLILYFESLSVFNFVINKIRYDSSALLHVLGIQLPIAISMYFYDY
tara:strand:- start:32 stop:385 length:354 start_codon:yes stop_codon:yes gene_type:complete